MGQLKLGFTVGCALASVVCATVSAQTTAGSPDLVLAPSGARLAPAGSFESRESRSPAPIRIVEEDNWDILVQLYGVLASIEGDAGVGGVGAPIDVDFSDILENLELAGMLHVEGYHQNGWGAIFDYSFMELGAESAGSLGVVLDADVRQGVLEALLSKRFELQGDTTVDAFGGVRWWDIDLDLSLSPGPVSRNRDVDWVDPVLGAKLATPIGDAWTFLARGDIGGFGIESDFSWNVDVGVQYHWSDSFAIELRYKALAVDFEEADGTPRAFSYDTVTHGPVIGLTWSL